MPRHPVQALAVAPGPTPRIYAALAETVYCLSPSTFELVSQWTAPAAPLQGKPQPLKQDTKENEEEEADEEEEVAEEGATAEAADVVMTEASAPVVGKRKRSPSASNDAAPVNPEPAPTADKSKKTKRGGKKKKNTGVIPPKAYPNYIGHMLLVPGRNVLAVTTLEDKTLRLLSQDTLQVVKEWTLHKRPSSIALIDNDSTIVVGDKFGDVYSFTIPPPSGALPEDSADNKLLLGHVSMLTTLTTASSSSSSSSSSSDGSNGHGTAKHKKYIITADRDEHVRVTNHPLTHVIHGFCLGHTQFVSRLLVTSSNRLISGGGDDWLGVWDWQNTNLLQTVEVRSILEGLFSESELKHLVEKMKTYNRRRRRREDEDEENSLSIGVNNILEVEAGGRGKEVVVIFEGVPAILRFKCNSDGGLEYISSIPTPGPVLSSTSDGAKVYIGCDGDSESLICCIDFTNDQPSVEKIFNGHSIEGVEVEEGEVDAVNERLYTVEVLRKGFGGMLEDD
ncbi:hypothetical protein H072_7357 [Dactylellina haptotyla CBS 200.50]|uniref:Uncharacterized protein n=1 Tax=Dactylellina haptotyla (strain CBS 200.50) TaxID=1284197 RepID=S8BUA2_DACHA|nr:hypothetical protein H072_7357 [Dactylellina haptotyla CBS 200.50]